jgi:DNA-binding response OmpR family regulator
MSAIRTILCIHRDPDQIAFLRENGYALVTAINGSEGLRLLMTKSVDAVILEYNLELLDGAVVADEIKQVRPQLPIVMLAESVDLPQGALKSVDALVTKPDGPQFLLATIHSILHAKDRPKSETARAERTRRPLEETISIPSKCQILLVDDDQSVRECVAMVLTEAGYDVIVAQDGFRTLSQLRKTLPQILVSDLEMPGMSGFELLSVVRRRFPQISTVAMSGAYTGEEIPFGVVADSFFAKGTQPRNLLRIVQKLLRTAPARSGEHYRECAPLWISRNGSDSQGMPYVVLTCEECLRAFPMNVIEESARNVVEVPCRFCLSINRYFIQPLDQCGQQVFA